MTPEERMERASQNLAEVNYRLRPGKSMARKMLVDLVRDIGYLVPLETYQYAGFGSLFFSDFRLIHQRLGIDRMTSIEKVWEAEDRLDFNKPYDCIEIITKPSQDAIHALNWASPIILWLDYNGYLKRDHLTHEIQKFFAEASLGSLLIITVRASPPHFGCDQEESELSHSEWIEEEFGPTEVPITVEDPLDGPDLAEVYREIIDAKIRSDYLPNRDVRESDKEVEFEFLLDLIYEDTSLMYTYGGILLSSDQVNEFDEIGLRDKHHFITGGECRYRIPQPNLTFSEIRHLEERMPGISEAVDPAIPSDDVDDFREVYRYYPKFVETEL